MWRLMYEDANGNWKQYQCLSEGRQPESEEEAQLWARRQAKRNINMKFCVMSKTFECVEEKKYAAVFN